MAMSGMTQHQATDDALVKEWLESTDALGDLEFTPRAKEFPLDTLAWEDYKTLFSTSSRLELNSSRWSIADLSAPRPRRVKVLPRKVSFIHFVPRSEKM